MCFLHHNYIRIISFCLPLDISSHLFFCIGGGGGGVEIESPPQFLVLSLSFLNWNSFSSGRLISKKHMLLGISFLCLSYSYRIDLSLLVL